MNTVLVFGTFDLLHAGHRYLLRQARRLREAGLADEVRLSDPEPRSFALLAEVRPDLICLGHDQRELERALREWMKRTRTRIPLKRIGRLPARHGAA
jgi:glycerol-3-phosphate cytidylyltransferase-like family protein